MALPLLKLELGNAPKEPSMRPRAFVTAVTLTAVLATPALAMAQDCPPGGWFCDQQAPQQPPPPPPPPQPAPPPPPVQVAPVQIPVLPQLPQIQVQGQVGGQIVVGVPQPPQVQVQPPPPPGQPPTVIIVTPGMRPMPPPPRYYPMPPPRYIPMPPPMYRRPPQQPQLASRFGLNLRVGGAFFSDENAAPDAAMFGVGGSIKYRPIPWAGVEAGLDVFGGKDYNGFDRMEVPFSLNGLIYFNPMSRFQVYAFGGANASHAWVSTNKVTPLLAFDGKQYSGEYDYFGGQLGLGVELRLGQHFGINLDAMGFIRTRTDDGPRPEFVSPSGQQTNTSGGFLTRAGINFWF